MNRPRPLVFPVWLAMAALLAAPACAARPGAARPEAAPPIPVAVETVEDRPWTDGLEATGSVESARRASPGTILAGRVTRIAKHEGDRVRAGDVLARVESADVAARVAQAEAAVVAARVGEDNARRMRERMERLVPCQAASPKNLEDAIAGHEAARASLHAAEEGVRAARVTLGYGQVTAPFDGVVVTRLVEEGDTAIPGMPMFVVEDTARMKIQAALPESVAREVRPGAVVTIVVDALGPTIRSATLAEILPSSDPATRTVIARVLLDNPGGALRPGMFARLRFAGRGRNAVSVSDRAIVRRGPLAGVFVVDAHGFARLRFITVGESRDGRVEALTGLEPGERVVAEPPAELADGRRVETLP